MVGRGSIRAVGISLSVLLLVLVGVSSVSASPSCVVNVSPKTGAAGSLFTFSGSGFKPTELSLSKDKEEATVHDLTQNSDPWTLAVRSRPGDEGKWTASFSSDQCTADVAFTVTLSNTDAVVPTSGTDGPGSLSPALLALVVAAGAAGGVMLGRRLSALPSDNSTL
jgi:hypothetical protein